MTRLLGGLGDAGFTIVNSGDTDCELTMKLKYMDPYESAWPGYSCNVDVSDRSGRVVLSEATTSFPGTIRGHEIYDWLPLVPILLTSAVNNDPQPLIDAMWGAFGESDSGAALTLKHFPNATVIQNLVDVSRERVRIELRFEKDSARVIHVTDGGDRGLDARQYQQLQPIAATKDGAFHSIVEIVSATEDSSLISLVAHDKEWVSDNTEKLVMALKTYRYASGASTRCGILLLLGAIRDPATRKAIRKCTKDQDARVRKTAKEALSAFPFSFWPF